MPQLDGLRALAVTGVVLQHYHLAEKGAEFGVHLFFVLSGFLITGILMKSRSVIETSGTNWKHAFRQFYIRRALRIFPLYYAVLLVAIVFNADSAREYSTWLLTYTINLKMAAQGWYISNFAHFWSLAVEEQYYLVWPCLILLLPRRRLVPAAVIFTAIGPLFRLSLAIFWIYVSKDPSPLNTYIATPTALDSLGIGSIISIVTSLQSTRSENRASIWIAVIIGVLLIIGAATVDAWWIFYDTVSAVFFGWLIYRAAGGFGGIAGLVLSSPPLVYIGRISYGIYVFHPLVPVTAAVFAAALGLTLPTGAAGVVISVFLTVVVASASWYSFERPLNNLKRRFSLAPGPATNLQAVA